MNQHSQDRPSGDAPASGAPNEIGQREADRDSLFLVADLRYSAHAEPVRVRIRNLSAGGLMAEYGDPIALGADVEIQVRGIGWVTGHIAWTAEGRVGIAFSREIDPMKARKPVGGGGGTPSYVKPVLSRR